MNLLRKKTLLIFSILILSLFYFCSGRSEINENDLLINQENGRVLTIVTRHYTTIQTKFRTEFLASQIAQDLGITGMNFYYATTDEGWKTLLEDPGIVVDLAWGGDQELFNKMDRLGLLQHIDNNTLVDYIQNNIASEFSHFVKSDENNSIIWAGNTIHTFGIIANQDFLEENGLDVPSKFKDLANESYYVSSDIKAILIGDPPLSTLNTKIFQIILQLYGWEEGWSILTRIGGNAGYYSTMFLNHEVFEEIRLTLDFFGVSAKRENPNTKFIIPNDTIVDTDPVALGINVDDQEAAEAFLQFIFSPEGQAVWMLPGLDRIPINEQAFQTPYGQTRTDIYETYNETIAMEEIYFNESLARNTLDITTYYFHNTITHNHQKLRKTWGEMVSQLRDGNISKTYFQELVEKLGKVNMTLEEAIEINAEMYYKSKLMSKYERRWELFARDKYDSIYCELTDTCVSETEMKIFQPLTLVNVFFILIVVRRLRGKKSFQTKIVENTK